MRLSLIVILWCLALPVEAAVVRLHRVATVDHSLLTLGDLAEVFDSDEALAAKLRQTELMPGPAPGTSLQIRLDQIESRLRDNPATGPLSFEGCHSVLVTRLQSTVISGAGRVVAPAPSTPRAVPQHRPLPSKSPAISDGTTGSSRVIQPGGVSAAQFAQAQQMVKSAVHAYLRQNAPDWGSPVIRPLLTTQQAPAVLNSPDGLVRILQGTQLDEEHFRLTVSPTGTTADAIPVSVRITLRPRILGAARDLPAGHLITPADLKWIEVDDARDGTAEIELVTGQQTRRPVRRDERLRPDQLKPAHLIRKGELVRVTAGSSRLRVSETFRAQRDGIRDDIIPLISLDGKRTVEARVSGVNEAVQIGVEDNTSGLKVTIGG
jgi:flagella basal body P-ring formation protein FlgA